MDWAKAHPDELIYGYLSRWSAGHFPWVQLKHISGIKTRDIPHSGGSEHLAALFSGAIPVGGTMTAQTLGHIRAGKLIPLVYFDDKRHPDLPNVPTAIEEGYNVVYRLWRGVLAPKKTPRPIIDKLAAGFEKICKDKTFKRMLSKFGDKPQYLGPNEFEKLWREEVKLAKELAKVLKE